ncbi:MAG: polymer-forming cytoskeletal protein [Rhodospirillaceae bacterium]|nr:polymer-forming cytoskeletal protein [Rhodospirillaceae bacterium]
MFSRPTKTAEEKRGAPPSIIASDCHISGDIVCSGEIQIDGRIEGDVQGDVVVIGEKGSIQGAISAKTVRILGAVNGRIMANAVELARTARVLGDIHHDSLAVAAGAYVEGHCDRLTSQDAIASQQTVLRIEDSSGEKNAQAAEPLSGATAAAHSG